MNNYNAMGKLLEFSITSIGHVRLCEAWSRQLILNGSFYRLYWQSHPGAGVIINKRRHNLMPDHFYLLPPNCNLPTFCDNREVKQLFVHFVLGHYDCAPLLTAIPATEKLMKYVHNIIDSFTETSLRIPVTRRYLDAFAWCAEAMATLPDGIFSVRPNMLGVERVCAIMEENPAQAHSIDSLAAAAGLSPAEITRRFKEATGQTPYAYLNTLRYETAAAMLSAGTSSIDDICEAVGIKDRFHFSRCFKKRYGHPPAAYRKLMQAQALPEMQ